MTRPLALHALHAGANARFGERGGAEVVLGFGSLEDEYRALVEAVGVADRSHRAIFRVVGPEARLFLHGLVTNDVKGVPAGKGNYTAIVNARGKMLGDGRLLVMGDEDLLLDLEPEAREQSLAHLDQHLISEDCTLSDATGEWLVVGAYGPRARDAVERALGVSLPALGLHDNALVPLDGGGALAVGAAPAGIEGVEVILDPSSGEGFFAALAAAAREQGGLAVGEDALDAARIHRVVPRYGAEMTEATIPLEANLDRAISYTKGCYVGQEVIAKATYRGRVRRKLGQLRVSPGVRPGAELLDGDRVVGTIASVLDPDPAGGPALALAYVRQDRLATGAKLAVAGGGEATIAWAPALEE
ncbi:MAG TPA: aminomethyl transferase family protein [Vulgatibacter sp.]|nr:aminomethyl transferase family protein [Vulgatibacter sp.]